MTEMDNTYPKDKPNYSSNREVPTLVAGADMPEGISIDLPVGVEPYDPLTMEDSYSQPQVDLEMNFIKQLSKYEKKLLTQYTETRCYLEEVDCYVGNRLTSYLLTIHPEISRKYPDYRDPLISETFSEEFPVVFKNRYMSIDKLLVILRGFRDLNFLLKKFPPLIETTYTNGYYLYRGKNYQGENELLTIGQTFVLSKLTSTTINPEISAIDFSYGINTKYKNSLGEVVQNDLGFMWRIKMPTHFPFPYIGHIDEEEVVLPIGTELRYLGCYVQESGEGAIYEGVTILRNQETMVDGALICEFEIVRIIPNNVLLQDLVSAVEEDFRNGNTRIYAEDLTVPSELWNQLLPKKPVLPEEAFGYKPTRRLKQRRKIRKTLKRKKRRHMKKRGTQTSNKKIL
jgi:hypothetical protein